MEGFECQRGSALRRVQKRDITSQHKVAFVIFGAGVLLPEIFRCQRQNPKAVIAEAFVFYFNPTAREDSIGDSLPSSSKYEL